MTVYVFDIAFEEELVVLRRKYPVERRRRRERRQSVKLGANNVMREVVHVLQVQCQDFYGNYRERHSLNHLSRIRTDLKEKKRMNFTV